MGTVVFLCFCSIVGIVEDTIVHKHCSQNLDAQMEDSNYGAVYSKWVIWDTVLPLTMHLHIPSDS